MIIFGTLLISLILFDVWLIYQIRGYACNLLQVDSLTSVMPINSWNLVALKRRIDDETWVREVDIAERCLGALRWTMNRTCVVAVNGERNPDHLLRSIESGKGALCEDMAFMYSHVLTASDVPNRIVFLCRNLFDSGDVHATVEVLLENRWVLMDPTFNVTFVDDIGQLLSAQEIKKLVLSGKCSNIHSVFHGDVLYPARIECFYMSILPCFNNVFVVDVTSQISVLFGTKFKICRVFHLLSHRRYFEKLPTESVTHIDFARRLRFVAIIILPIFVVFISLVMLASFERV
jgi:hypothetical protein